MNIKMIATDLDGTLLKNDETLPKEAIEIVNRCKKKGVRFVVATARSEKSALRICEDMKPDAMITSGGANAICNNDVIYEALLSVEESKRIIKKCIADQNIDYIRVIGIKVDLTNNPNVNHNEMEFVHYKKTNFEVIPDQKVSKITICSSNIEYIKKLFQDEYNCSLITSYSGSNMHKLAHQKATKEDALFEVAKYFGLDFANILAFGDDTSDINMLKMSRIGIAVANAKQSVKDIANEVCDTNENRGVLNYISSYFGLFGS